MPSLVLDGLVKSFGEVRALDGVSFQVAAGELFGFVGANGAGKTTAMRIVLGVLSSDAGAVSWDGAPVGPDVRRRIGYMPEERGLYPRMKVGEQLVYLARLHGLSIAAATQAMDHWTEVLGVADRRGDAVEKLSLGNQQRVQLASALVHGPDILVLDEPFSGLDPVAVGVMSEVLRGQAERGVPVIFSSHQLELVERLCDRVGIIRSGRLVACGTVDSLTATARPRWTLEAELPPAWAPAADGETRVEPVAEGAWLVEAPDAAAAQTVLAAALAAGTVRAFTPSRPTLTELFRDVMLEPSEVPA
ncbi:ATP-binding cassette domain-containing protein [Demequina capsici]|uniref:ATP-binding cassette domain-containing protein n=1 Tax=Demequina capsici TaxID=3075620 RepID=A0AA96FBS8_9MICO|nr:ATP-binding cassette domain-containing protein [Demequina sp. PMTSA13]WNM26828.1 ATP-binding cassette domain-containing protein [Demequina sp. PMTSA13]